MRTVERARPLAWLVAGLLAACGAPEPPGPRLVVLYATCSLDKHFLQPHDPSVGFTPNLAALARESVVFERHVTEAGVSGIAYASLFTGAQADEHGIFHHPSRLPGRMLTIFEAFGAAGWETHYFNGHKMAAAELDYAQGVAPEHVYPSQARKRDVLTAADPDFARLLARLVAEPELRALVVVNFTVTHAAYTAQLEPEELAAFLERHPQASEGVTLTDLRRLGRIYEENRLPLQWDYPATVARLGLSEADQEELARLLRVVYRADVEILDGIVGRCRTALEDSGLLEQTLLAFTADHGEYLFQRARPFQWGHGLQLAPEELSVPWILRAPAGTLASGRYPGVTRSIDVFPTLAGLARVPLPAGAPVQGVDLAPVLRGEAAAPVLLGPAHTKVLDERLMREFADLALVRGLFPSMDPGLMWVAVRDGDRFARWRNRGDGTFVHEHFDLAADPFALTSVFDERDPEHARLARWLEAYKERLLAATGADRGVDESAIEADLKALGYVR
ncbi:MAG TPA: sulfatase-like hydrolase/transferase [Planctomycetota bacterium]